MKCQKQVWCYIGAVIMWQARAEVGEEPSALCAAQPMMQGSSRSLLQHGVSAAPSLSSPPPDGSDILVVVLGYGESDRAPQLISNLEFLVDQAPGVQCVVFVWDSHATTDGFPSRCRIEKTDGVFMTFLQKVPPDTLLSAQHIFLMADDLDLKTEKPVNLLELAQFMSSHNLDIASPAMIGRVHYPIMSPTSDCLARYVDFIEWQAQMVSIQTFNILRYSIEPDITGCWAYDDFIYSMLLTLKGSANITILNTMTMEHKKDNGVSFSRGKSTACGRIGSHGEHLAALDMQAHFRQKGLRSAKKIELGTILE